MSTVHVMCTYMNMHDYVDSTVFRKHACAMHGRLHANVPEPAWSMNATCMSFILGEVTGV